MEIAEDYRQLTEAEISTLRGQGCMAEDWNSIFVRGSFAPERIVGVSFIGTVRLGDMNGTVSQKSKGLGAARSAIIRSTLKDVTLGDWYYIQDVSLLSGYRIGGRFVCVGCGQIIGGEGPFGIGERVSVVNEGGGREVAMSAHLTSNIAYMVACHRYVSGLVDGYEDLVRREAGGLSAEIDKDVHIYGTRNIESVRIGRRAVIDGASSLRHGTILSAEGQATEVGADVDASHFVMAEGAKAYGGAKLRHCFIGQCATVGEGFFGENVMAFANSQLLCGEGVSVMAGPYTVSHHKSSLLIAESVSFYNAGSATNASNHHYRLGPIQQAVMERGCKTGSGSYILEPAHIGAFTMVVGHHKTHPDTSMFPFSVLAERDGESHLIVAQNLRTIGLFRDGIKWKRRDSRTLLKGDAVTYDVLNPLTVGRMMSAVRKIEGEWAEARSEYLLEGGLRIRRALLPRGAKAYRNAIDLYLAKAYAHDKGASEGYESDWADVGGLVAPVSEVREIERKIADGEFGTVKELAESISSMAERAKELSIRWAVGQARAWYGYSDKDEDVKDAVQLLAEACHEMKEALMVDASREWGPKLKTGYGLDGDDDDKANDFKALRGEMDENADVRECARYFDETW